MAKKKEKGEQLDLIDVAPENAKPIMEAARKYQHHQKVRIAAGVKEKEQKELIKELVGKADLQPLAGGKIKFEYDGLRITITPRDELVQVTDISKAKVDPAPKE